jgi:hypothetical protein
MKIFGASWKALALSESQMAKANLIDYVLNGLLSTNLMRRRGIVCTIAFCAIISPSFAAGISAENAPATMRIGKLELNTAAGLSEFVKVTSAEETTRLPASEAALSSESRSRSMPATLPVIGIRTPNATDGIHTPDAQYEPVPSVSLTHWRMSFDDAEAGHKV